jgi:hypothetical protein
MSSQSEDFFSRESNPEFYGLELMLITAPPRTHVLSLDKCVRGGALNNNKVLIHASVAERLLIPALDRAIPGSIPGDIIRLKLHHQGIKQIVRIFGLDLVRINELIKTARSAVP